DGVDNPQARPDARHRFEAGRHLLGAQRVAGEDAVDVAEDGFLRFAVGDGADVDGGVLDLLEGGVVAEDDLAGLPRRLQGRGQLALERRVHVGYAMKKTRRLRRSAERYAASGEEGHTTSAISLNSM